MIRHRFLSVMSVGLVLLSSAGTVLAVGMDAQRIVVRRCVAILPPEIEVA